MQSNQRKILSSSTSKATSALHCTRDSISMDSGLSPTRSPAPTWPDVRNNRSTPARRTGMQRLCQTRQPRVAEQTLVGPELERIERLVGDFDGVLAEVGVELCAKRRLRLECERDVLLVLQPLLEQQGEVSGGGGSGGGDGGGSAGGSAGRVSTRVETGDASQKAAN